MRRDVLLLQGPIGPFFARFAADLEGRGFTVTKVNFNGGDRAFYQRAGAIDYLGSLDEWSAWLERLLINRAIGRIYLFGDCRAYHRIAREVAARNQVRVFVFEEGYIRPNFITLEENGVNAHSSMMQNPVSIEAAASELPDEYPQPKGIFRVTACYAMIYYWVSAARSRRFAHYRHHRPFDWFAEGLRWIRSGVRKLYYAWRERHVFEALHAQFDGNYFVCPLQVHCDMQVVVHSNFNSIEHFIGEVFASFRKHAPANKALVFKHHPLDRGYTDYSTLFDNLIAELGLQGRVFYVHDLCLPTLLQHAQGTVLINSTVGMSSLFHGTPVKTLGSAIYDRPNLTYQGSLDEFWKHDERVDQETFLAFRNNLVARNQLNGNFYRRLESGGGCGIVWPTRLEQEHAFDADRIDHVGERRFRVIEGGAGATAILPADERRDDDDVAAA